MQFLTSSDIVLSSFWGAIRICHDCARLDVKSFLISSQHPRKSSACVWACIGLMALLQKRAKLHWTEALVCHSLDIWFGNIELFVKQELMHSEELSISNKSHFRQLVRGIRMSRGCQSDLESAFNLLPQKWTDTLACVLRFCLSMFAFKWELCSRIVAIQSQGRIITSSRSQFGFIMCPKRCKCGAQSSQTLYFHPNKLPSDLHTKRVPVLPPPRSVTP